MNRTTQIILTLLVAGVGAWLGTSEKFYSEAIISAFFALALFSVAIIHLRVSPHWQDGAAIVGLTLLLGLVDFRLLHFQPQLMAWFSFCGMSSLVILGLRTIWAKAESQKLLALAFVPAVLYVTSEYFASTFLAWCAAAHAKVFDLYLISFDGALHVQFPFLAGQAFAKWGMLGLVSTIFYIALPIPIALIYVGRLLRFGAKALPSFVALLATGPVGIVFYNLLPALGPRHIFLGRFPWQPLTISEISRLFLVPVPGAGAPNAIPSLHMAWVLLVWWYSRGLSWWERSVAMIFLVFTVLATLGTGEHYFIDLVVAFPFALLMAALCAFSLPVTDAARVKGVVFGLAATLGWEIALRRAPHFFWISPVLPWVLCCGSVALTILYERRLGKPSEAVVVAPAL